jgi:nucleoside-diphosphate kinase
MPSQLITEQTYVMVKPDGVNRGLVGEIVSRIEKTGLKLVGAKMFVPDVSRLTVHYGKDDVWCEAKGQKTINNIVAKGEQPTKPAVEYGRDIVRALLDFMSSGPVLAMIWEGNSAVNVVKKLVGDTEPVSSPVGTIRGDLCLDSYNLANDDDRAVRNLIHCSDIPAEAVKEIGIWFTPEEIVSYSTANESVMY